MDLCPCTHQGHFVQGFMWFSVSETQGKKKKETLSYASDETNYKLMVIAKYSQELPAWNDG